MLGLPRLYDLDRLDLTVDTTLDGKVQKSRGARPASAWRTRKYVDSVGLQRLPPAATRAILPRWSTASPSTKPWAASNLLRVQADNYEQPLNINEGVKLDLGSTAKLRTLVNYLEIIADLHGGLLGQAAAS